MAQVTLQWKKTKSGEVYTVHNSVRYSLHQLNKTVWVLKIDGVDKLKGTKEVCKAHAMSVVNKPPPKVKKKKVKFKPTGCPDCDWLLGEGHPEAAVKTMHEMFHQPPPKKTLPNGTAPEVEKPVEQAPPPEPEVYKGPKPKERKKELSRVIAVSGKPPTLDDAKWSTIYQWAEDLRDEYEEGKQLLTVPALFNLVLGQKHLSPERQAKVLNRLRVIYRDEYEAEAEHVRRLERGHFAAPGAAGSSAAYTAGTGSPATQQGGREIAAYSGVKATKKPGIITRIIEVLRSASKKKPVTKEQILEELKKSFPERDAKAMKNTIGSQIPSGLLTEKNLKVSKDDKGGYWLE